MNIGLVAPYPPQNSVHSQQSGEAWYSKKLAGSLNRENLKVAVFANRLGNTASKYDDSGVNVDRCWDFGFKSWFQICSAVLKKRKELDILHVQFAIFLFGGFSSVVVFPVFLLLMKFVGLKVVITFHQTIPLSNINKKFEDETGIRGNQALLKKGLYTFVKMLVALTDTTIVHEPFFKEVLVRDYRTKSDKIKIVHLGVDEVEVRTDPKLARIMLGIPESKPVVLFFGYLAKYKGLENLIDALVSGPQSDYVLLVAGGEHPRMRKKKEYSDYLAMLHEKAARAPDRVRFTGFVPEHQLPFIFAAADVVVLPYTRAISSSGPLSLCVAYNKPFLASESLKEIINEPAIMFPNTAEGIGKIINSFINDDFLKERARLYSLSLLHDRRWENVALKTAQIYNKIAQSYGVVDKPEPSIPVMDFVSFEESSVFDELFSSRPPKNI